MLFSARRTRVAHVAPLFATVAVASALAAGSALAQATARDRVFLVRVVDSLGTPVAGAEVSVVRGLDAVLARGITDSTGRRSVRVALKDGEYEVLARKIGHRRAERLIAVAGRDSFAVQLVAPRTPQQLEAVAVTGRLTTRQRLLSIDADAIAASHTTLRDAADIVTRLRPDMLYGLAGTRRANCAPLSFVWVNGRRIRFPPLDAMEARERAITLEAVGAARVRSRQIGGGRPPQPPRGRGAIPLDVSSVLASIKPEHIAEMRYTDCTDLTVDRASATSALFVVLKEGVKYMTGRGSFVASPTRAGEASVVGVAAEDAQSDAAIDDTTSAASDSAAVAPAALTTSRPYPRVIGVFDAESGAPLRDVTVVDLTSGWRAATTATGTARLAFPGIGERRVRLERQGYRADELTITLSARDTVPITTVLSRAP